MNRPYLCLMKRSFDPAVPEMMDRPQPVSHELERDLNGFGNLIASSAVIVSFRLSYGAG